MSTRLLVTFEQTSSLGHKSTHMRVVDNIPRYLLNHNERYPGITLIPLCAIPLTQGEADMIDGQLNGM